MTLHFKEHYKRDLIMVEYLPPIEPLLLKNSKGEYLTPYEKNRVYLHAEKIRKERLHKVW